ncbi:nitroreductase family protein [Lachnospiraceae bacterium 54-53]
MKKPLLELRHMFGITRLKLKSRKVAMKELAAASKNLSGGTVTNTLLVTHTLEKGMGIQNVKKGYGIEKAVSLCGFLKELKDAKQDNTYAFKEGLAVLWAYIVYQESEGIDIKVIKERAEKLGKSSIKNAGYKIIPRNELQRGINIDFEALVFSKHSVRSMSKEQITETEINDAIRYTVRAPSACNRQPSRVYYSLDPEKNKALARMVPGNKGFSEDIPYYCVITADRNMFRGGEMFQWYVNGGIFVGYFVLALHSIGIGSCIFQYPQFSKNETQLRSLIHADEREAIIAIIGYGKYSDEAKCICAERKPLSEVAEVF